LILALIVSIKSAKIKLNQTVHRVKYFSLINPLYLCRFLTALGKFAFQSQAMGSNWQNKTHLLRANGSCVVVGRRF